MRGLDTSNHAASAMHCCPAVAVTGAWFQQKQLEYPITSVMLLSNQTKELLKHWVLLLQRMHPLSHKLFHKVTSSTLKVSLWLVPRMPTEPHFFESELVEISSFYLFITSWHTFLPKSTDFFPSCFLTTMIFPTSLCFTSFKKPFFSCTMNSQFPRSTAPNLT